MRRSLRSRRRRAGDPHLRHRVRRRGEPVRLRLVRPEGHQGDLRRRHRHAERRARRGRRRARTSSSTSPPTRPARSTCTPSPEQELEYKAGETDADDQGHRPARHRRRRVAHAGEGHRPARSRRPLRCHPTASRSPTGSAAPRTSRSRPSWRSPARPRPWSSRSPSSRSPGATRATTPPRPVARRPPGSPASSTRPGGGCCGGRVGFVLFLYVAAAAVFGKDLVINPVFGVFYVWWWVGLVPLSLLFGPVWKAISPVRTINLALREGLRQRPRARRLHLPRAARALAGGGRPLRLRLARAGLPLLDRARPGPAVVRGVRRGDAGRRRPLRQRLLRAGRPVRGLLDAGLADVGLGPPRRRAADPQPAGQPRLDARPLPGLVGVVAVLFGSTAFDSFKDSAHWVQFVQGSDRVGATCSTTWRC